MQLKSVWHLPQFAVWARRSMIQAKTSPGIVHAMGTYRHGIHHTLSVWHDKLCMTKYLRSGDHKLAINVVRGIGSFVKVYGYELDSDSIPSMDEALELWEQHGKVVFREPCNIQHDNNKSKSMGLVGTDTTRNAALLPLLYTVIACFVILALVNGFSDIMQ